jgi:hypothetical protein
MRVIRIFSVLALAALVAPAAASAAKKPKPAAWAAKHKLNGAWRAKDADRDGLKNLQEFKLGTDPRKADSDRDGLKDGDEVASSNNPRKADTDRDGVKDGAEHAGVVTAFDGKTITIRQFSGPKLVASFDADCGSDEAIADDSAADDVDAGLDDGYVEVEDEGDWVDEGDDVTAEASRVDPEETVIDFADEDVTAEDSAAGCDIGVGDVLRSAEVERAEGVLYLIGLELA